MNTPEFNELLIQQHLETIVDLNRQRDAARAELAEARGKIVELSSRLARGSLRLSRTRRKLAEARAALDWAADKLTELSDNAGRWTRDEIMCEAGHCQPEGEKP